MKNLNIKLQQQFDKMCETQNLFRVFIKSDVLWKTYLNGFADGDDPVFRSAESSTHNCNTCHRFIENYGNIVAIGKNDELISLFDIDIEGEYASSMKAMTKLIYDTCVITKPFVETFDNLNSLPFEVCNKISSKYKLGLAVNYKTYTQEEADVWGVITTGEIYTFNHMMVSLPSKFLNRSGESIESIVSNRVSSASTLIRAMEEIPTSVYENVIDLINQNLLLNGNTHVAAVKGMLQLKIGYDKSNNKHNKAWKDAANNSHLTRFRNSLVGVLCTDIAKGVELEVACNLWNKRIDPINYKKASAIVTKAQKEKAQRFIVEHGYIDSLNRKPAKLDDIKAAEIKHIGESSDKVLGGVSMFDNIKTPQLKPIKISNAQEVKVEKFMSEWLPKCDSIEVMLENRLEQSMVTLTTSVNKSSKGIFQWDNDFSWTYAGNLSGKSEIKQQVKNNGGNVSGILRGSIMWAEEDSTDDSDLDIHCITPTGIIKFNNRILGSGKLDIDIISPNEHKAEKGLNPIENIIFSEGMIDGNYKFAVHNYSDHGSLGFKAEIEFENTIYSYSYDQPVASLVHFATVTLKEGIFTIKHILPEADEAKVIWGLDSNIFHKVNLMCLSPNHWNGEEKGNKHFFFMLDECKNPEKIRTFHNENLNAELSMHRKVLEVLAKVNTIDVEGDQLSGIGFNSTVKNELLVKMSIEGKNKIIKVMFGV